MAATVEGDERVIAAAQQIVKSLATSTNVAEDMLVILSSFDNRLSTISTSLLQSSSASTSASTSASSFKHANTNENAPTEPSSELLLNSAESLIHRWDSPSAGCLPWDDPDDSSPRDYLLAVDHLLSLLDAGDPALLDRAESALQIAMSRLEDEFRFLLSSNPLPLDPDSLLGSIRRFSLSFPSSPSPSSEDDEDDTNDDVDSTSSSPTTAPRTRGRSLSGSVPTSSPVDLVRPEAVENLREIAHRMLRARYEKECCQAYSTVRRDALDECLCVLGVERVSIEEVQRIEWPSLDDRMKKWIQAVRVVVRVLLLDGEKPLCDRVFGEGADVVKEVCFVESAKGCVTHLLNFGEAVAIGHRSPEKLFRILDMYDALSEVLPDLRALFPGEDFVCGEAEGILHALGDAARGTFVEFEKAIQREASRKPMQSAEIHPLTRYVMNYSKFLVDYSATLDVLLHDGDQGGGADSYDSYSGSMTPVGRRLRLVLSYLEANLENKSKLYDDGAMQCIFLMNNILYIVQKVKDSDLGRLLGDQWIRKRRGQIRQLATKYLRASWTKVLLFLRDDGVGGGSGGNSVSKVALKERFKNFNLAYEEIYRTQVAWKVPDAQLREELRISISEMVIPAYRSFMGRYGSQLEGRNAGKYVKYTPENLEGHLADLFEGSAGPSCNLRRKLSS